MPHQPDILERPDLQQLPGADTTNFEALRARDKELFHELEIRYDETRYEPENTGLRFTNETLAALAKPSYTKAELTELEELLHQKGTLTVPIKSGFTVAVGGAEQAVSIVAATETDANHGDMSSMLYLRDHVQAASALMDLNLQDQQRYREEGEAARTLLLSALHLMSTDSQLARFQDVIKRGNEAGQADWPQISLFFDDLEGIRPNGWRNKQDTFQMLAFLTLDAIEKGFIKEEELLEPHKKFLGSVVPLLASVGYPTYETSGSWEENAAHRTSVMAVETAFLHKVRTALDANNLGFLQDTYEELAPDTSSFQRVVSRMLDSGLQEIGCRLPDESPDYDSDSVKYREADAALAYILMYDIPLLLTQHKVPVGQKRSVLSRRAIEDLVLTQIARLDDPETGGVFRYEDDSYQRKNFHTHEVQWVIHAIKQKVKNDANGGESDLDEKQALRNSLTPKGRPAAWTHPLGQLGSWAARRSLESRSEDQDAAASYRTLSTHFFNRGLSTVTGDNQWNAVLSDGGGYAVRPVMPFRLPECYVTYETDSGKKSIVPSPHTPLNWSAVEMRRTTGLLLASTLD